jgi:hypothetical protein
MNVDLFGLSAIVVLSLTLVGIRIYGWIQNNGGVQPKKAAKHAPYAPAWYVPPPPAIPTSFKVGNNFQAPTYNTSSLNVPPINNIGKPLTIQNWDRLTGMMVRVLSRRWIVTQAMHTLSGYECVLQTAGVAHTINVCIYGDMYDSHRVSVFCKGKIAHIDIGVCKDPNALLHSIAVEFTDKFDIWN